MRAALYYPHTSIESVELVKTALLLWDRLEYIVPWQGFRAEYDDPIIARAMEIVGVAHCPTPEEQAETHGHIEELVNRPLPPNFYYGMERHRNQNHDVYEIYPQKFLQETWRLLCDSKLSGTLLPNNDYPLSQPAGLTIMSILADCCAGKTRCRVTDRSAAYATLTGIFGTDAANGPEEGNILHERLVPITLNILDLQSIELEDLIKFREREEKESGHTIRDLRHRYVASLEGCVKRLTTQVGNATDAPEIIREFADDMKIDFKKLQSEIRGAGLNAVLSKEVLVTALAAVGTVASFAFGLSIPLLGAVSTAGVPATVGGVLGAVNQYLTARRSILQDHPMAYLYELQR
jgi:hypothetical protein